MGGPALACAALFEALGLRGIGIGAAAAVLFAVNVTAVVPATPSNIGVFQLAVISVLTTGFGVGAADALAYGVILQAVEIATAVALGPAGAGPRGPDLVGHAAARAERRAGAPLAAARVGARRHGLGLAAHVCCSLSPMALSNVSGFPRIGPQSRAQVRDRGLLARRRLRGGAARGARSASGSTTGGFMQQAGIDLIPSNDFSLYDHVLDTIALVGAVPERYGDGGGNVDLDTYFAMARGRQEGGVDVTAMEMTKWFDTNYHYIVPELGPETSFSLSATKPFDEHAEAMEELGDGHRAGDPGAGVVPAARQGR